MRVLSFTLAGLLGLAAIVTMAGYTPTASAQTTADHGCPPEHPWQEAGYGGDGKWVPGHCEGQAAQ
jgi:hypothetical protein